MLEAEAVTDPGVTGATLVESGPELGYTVSVDAFSGPLDLLLFLVRKSELDIIEIPIATITDQFVALIKQWQQQGELDLEAAGDFILMAATLLEIKARTIAPPPLDEGEVATNDDDDALDPRADLIGKLLAYRRFKEAVGVLGELENARSLRVLRQTREDIPEDPDEATGIDLGELDVTQLSALWQTLLMRIGGGGPRTVMKDDIPIEGSIRRLTERAGSEKQLTLRQLFAAEDTLQGRVTMLMATLECTRQRIVLTAQHEQYGEVELRFRDEADRVITVTTFAPDEPTKKRRKRPPLVTYHAPVAPTADELEDAPEAADEKMETDEDRFLRELNEACDLDGVLARVVDVEQGFQQYWELLHPPVIVPVVIPEPVLAVASISAGEVPALVEVALTAVEPVAVEPRVIEPVAREPVAVEPVAVEPVAVEPVASKTDVEVEPQAVQVPIVDAIDSPVLAAVEPVLSPTEVNCETPIVSALSIDVIQPEPAPAPEPEHTMVTAPVEAAIVDVAAAQSPHVAEAEVLASEPLLELASEPIATEAITPEAIADVTADVSATPMQPVASILPTEVVEETPPEPIIQAVASVSLAISHEPHIQVDLELSEPTPEIDDLRDNLTPEDVALVAPDAPVALPPTTEVISLAPSAPPEVPTPPAAVELALPPALVAETNISDLAPDLPEITEPTITVALSRESPKVIERSADPVIPMTELATIAQPIPVPVVVEQTFIAPPVVPSPVVPSPLIPQALVPPSVRRSAPRPLTRTLWVLLAGITAGSITGWLMLAQSATLIPSETPLALTADVVPQPLVDVVPASTPVVDPSVESLPPLTPSSAVLIIPMAEPTAALRRVSAGPPETWLDAVQVDAWPVAVPWSACLPRPTRPLSLSAFAQPANFTDLPVAVFADDVAWAWCSHGAWVIAPVCVVPTLAFIEPLELPPDVSAWMVMPALRSMPVAVFGEPLGWTVLCRQGAPFQF